MKQVFPPYANMIARGSILAGVAVVMGAFAVLATQNEPEYIRNKGIFVSQPVPFSHEHHVAGLGIDCRYCHTSVEESSFAGFPSTEVCMTCHSQVWTNSPLLEPVRRSFRENVPLQWNRVHNLPDFTFFDHSIHVNKGISCQTCHGEVDRMPLMKMANSLKMGWCLECHRHPELNVQPRETVFSKEPVRTTREEREQLVKEYDIQVFQLENCSICHR